MSEEYSVHIPLTEIEEMFYRGYEQSYTTPFGRLQVIPNPEDVYQPKGGCPSCHGKGERRRRWRTGPSGKLLAPSDRRRGVGRREHDGEAKYGIAPPYGRRYEKDRRK